MAAEYEQFSVGWVPDCHEFENNGSDSSYFTWETLNGGFADGNPHTGWSLVTQNLRNMADNTVATYTRASFFMISGYRCPHGNASLQPNPGALNSRHMYGDADGYQEGGWDVGFHGVDIPQECRT